MQFRMLQLVATCVLLMFKVVKGDAMSDLHHLFEGFYSWRLEDSPEFATYMGTYRYNDRLYSFNISNHKNRYDIANHYLYELNRINSPELSPADIINYRILKDILDTYLDGYKWSQFGSLSPLNFLEGNQLNPGHQVDATPFYTRGDYENYLVRLQATPVQFQQYKDLYKKAISLNRTAHNVSIERVPDQIARLLVISEESPFYHPFSHFLDNQQVTEEVKAEVRQRAKSIISSLTGAFQDIKNFLENEYIPNTRPGWGVGSLDHGKDYYKACLKWHLSTDMTPEEVHEIGLQEVERIATLMQEILDRQNFKGTIAEYFEVLKNDSSLHMETEDEVLDRYRKIINERVNPRLPEMFDNLPNLPVRVERMPYDGPGVQYIYGSEDGSRQGIVMVNVNRPRETGTYLMVPMSLHEAIPGHHLQSTYSLQANLPKFRRNVELARYFEVPYHFPIYTAYIEGWSLYAESLGEELHLYEHDYELMGRYILEMFRASRLVVDTGLHYYGWDREYAIDYMLNYTSFSRAWMSIEVDRYITWPGQACAYKIGEIKMKQLRRRAKQILGENFNIKDFHSVLLENGPMPLNILEDIVDDWILHYGSRRTEPELCLNAAGSHESSSSVTLCLITLAAMFKIYCL